MTIGLAAAPLSILLALAATSADQRTVPGFAERVRRPEGFECPLDWTTNYTGVVARFSRERERTVLDIRTDWETTERVVITHAASLFPVIFGVPTTIVGSAPTAG